MYGVDYPEVGDPGPADNPALEAEHHHVHRGQARMAYRLAESHGDRLMYVHGLGWHYWDGRRWAEDDRGAAKRAVLDALRRALAESLDDKALRADVHKCESAAGLNGVLDIASALETFAVTVADLDADPWLLNTASGTLDLRTLGLTEHDPADRLTKVTTGAYRPEATAPEWDAFLGRVLPEESVRSYLQRFAGVSLLGKVEQHILAIATGEGANGKGTSYGALLHALGDYGHAAESDLFMASRADANAPKPAVMRLRGRRLVVVSETEREHPLAAALMKNLTGGDRITARTLHAQPVTFDPAHTPLMVTNHLPKVAGDDPAIWRRLRVIPFNVVIPAEQRDEQLGDRLALEADGILAWAVAGWQQYREQGMADPEAVRVATRDYQRLSDAVGRFVDDCCLIGTHWHVSVSDLWERWCRWRAEDGADEVSKKAFNEALDKRGYPTHRGAQGRRIRRGLGLQSDTEEGTADGF